MNPRNEQMYPVYLELPWLGKGKRQKEHSIMLWKRKSMLNSSRKPASSQTEDLKLTHFGPLFAHTVKETFLKPALYVA